MVDVQTYKHLRYTIIVAISLCFLFWSNLPKHIATRSIRVVAKDEEAILEEVTAVTNSSMAPRGASLPLLMTTDEAKTSPIQPQQPVYFEALEDQDKDTAEKFLMGSLDKQQNNFNRTCLIHVGKTGGSVISCAIGIPTGVCEIGSNTWFRYEKFRNISSIPGRIGRYNRVHMGHTDCHPDTESFLVATRNPITRIASWFDYERVSKRPESPSGYTKKDYMKKWIRSFLFVDCYQTLVSLATDGLSSANITNGTSASNGNTATTIPGDVREMTCPQRAWAAITGARAFSQHNWYNYEYYTEVMGEFTRDRGERKEVEVFVLRNEHLPQDWNAVDRMLGGTGTSGDTFFTEKLRSAKNAKPDLIPVYPLLCNALCREIQYYKRILVSAANLNEAQVLESISAVQQMCPEETTDVRSCPDVPQFPPQPATDPFIMRGKKRFICCNDCSGDDDDTRRCRKIGS